MKPMCTPETEDWPSVDTSGLPTFITAYLEHEPEGDHLVIPLTAAENPLRVTIKGREYIPKGES